MCAQVGKDGPEVFVPSEGPSRIINNSMRHQYRQLSDTEKAQMVAIKDMGLAFDNLLLSPGMPAGRDMDLARDRIKEAVMWSVRAITK